jgi:VWFA-related protein
MLSTRVPRLFLVLATSVLFLPPRISAQDAIRVESNQVLVPTVIFDRQLYNQLNKMQAHHRDSYRHLVSKNSKLWESIAVSNLDAKEFHLFEDGQEMRMQSVKLEQPPFRTVQDSLGKHPEVVGSGGGIWAYPDRPLTDLSIWLAWPQYVLAYVPPASAIGSCHRIDVKVERADLGVWARSEYCNTKHLSTDPLSGTEFGKHLEAALNSTKENKIDLRLQVASFYYNTDARRIYLALRFPSDSLKHEFKDGTLYATIGVLVMVNKKDGSLAAQYSDFACCDYGNQKQSVSNAQDNGTSAEASALMPARYETQFDLSPGEYTIRVVLSDGQNFGSQQAQLKVQNPDPQQLSISDIALSRRVHKLVSEPSERSPQVLENYTPLVSKGVEFTPAADTRFSQSETLYAYFEVYDPLTGPAPTTVQSHLRILDADTGAVRTNFEPVNASSYFTAGSKLISIGRGISLTSLPKGSYNLQVKATDATGKSTPWQTVNFSVESDQSLKTANIQAASKLEADTANRNGVILNVSALDATGHPVTDLTRADFQVFDDDQPQVITSFRANSLKTMPGAAVSTTLILFDLLNTMPRQREYIASCIVHALEPLETDEGMYLYLLTNKGELYAVHPATPPSATPPRGVGVEDTSEPWTRQIHPLLDHAIDAVHGFRLMDYRDEGQRTVITVDRLGQISDQLAKIPEPKTILWITTGVPNSVMYPYGGCQDLTLHDSSGTYMAGKCGLECRPNPSEHKCMDYSPFLQHFAARLNKSNTTISSVEVTGEGALPRTDSGTPADTLRQLAFLTGGRVFLDTNAEVEKAISESLTSSKARYQFTYTGPARDGKYHRLRVVCTREGVRIQFQQGYFAVPH